MLVLSICPGGCAPEDQEAPYAPMARAPSDHGTPTQPKPKTTIAPVFMLLESGPSDPIYHEPGTPIFAFYRNGLVIWLDQARYDDKLVEQHYLCVHLPEEERISLLKVLFPENVWKLCNVYDASGGAWDVTSLGLYFWDNEDRRTIWVNGWDWQWSRLPKRKPGTVLSGWQVEEFRRAARARSLVPPRIATIIKTALGFQHPATSSWTPKAVELLLLPTSVTPNATDWPPELPSAKDLVFVRAPADGYCEEVHSICRVDSRYLPALRKETRGQTLLSLNRHHVVTYRLPFPAEEHWRGGGTPRSRRDRTPGRPGAARPPAAHESQDR